MENGNIPVVPVVLAIFAIIAFVLFLGMIVLFAFLISRAAKRRGYDRARGEELRAAAEQISFNFQAQAALSGLPFFAGYELFEGNPLKFENVMTRKIDGRDSAIFDLVYRNVSGGGSGTTTSRQTMAAMDSRDLGLPDFYLRPQGTMERVLNVFSNVDINFADKPGFSKMFLLYGKDEPAIRRVFTGDRMRRLEQVPWLCVTSFRGTLFVYASRSLAPRPQFIEYGAILQHIHQVFGPTRDGTVSGTPTQ